jgi:hypothetical protein
MRTIEVGKLFDPRLTRWDDGVSEYNYRGGYHRLIIPLARPTPDEIEAVRFGAAKFAFTTIGPVIVFQFRFGTAISWSDALYTWHKVPVEERVEPVTLTGEQRVPLEVFLLDAATGIVRAIRVLTLSPTFSRRLHEAIRRQAAEPFPDNYDELAAHVLTNYTSRQLRDRALASCTGGDGVDRPSPY